MTLTRRDILIGTAAGMLVAGPGKGRSETAARPVTGGKLAWGVESEPNTLNPHLNSQAKAKLVLRNAFKSLPARAPDGSYVPWLASAYDISKDGKTDTFTVREDVKFSDGERLDAAAVALNFTRLRNPAYSGSISAGLVSRVADVRALDAYTVVLSLDTVYSPFLTGSAGLEIISPRLFGSSQLKSGGKEIAGTGPFVLDRYARGQDIRFVRNPAYNWAPSTARHQGPAHLDEFTYRFFCLNPRSEPAHSPPARST